VGTASNPSINAFSLKEYQNMLALRHDILCVLRYFNCELTFLGNLSGDLLRPGFKLHFPEVCVYFSQA
jgi:hypothetical protein